MRRMREGLELRARGIWHRLPAAAFRRRVLRFTRGVWTLLLHDEAVAERAGGPEPETFIDREYMDLRSVDQRGRSTASLLKTIEVGCSVLEALNVEYWVARGTLLGWYRNGDFLPGDIDIDIDVHTERHVFDILRQMPFEVILATTHQQTGRFMQLAFMDRETNVIFDLFFYHDEGGEMVSRIHAGRLSLPKSVLTNLSTMRIGSCEYPVPDPEWYCTYWYGPGWRVPCTYAEDAVWDAYERDCRGFLRTPGNRLERIIYFG